MVNKIKINLNTRDISISASTINIPIDLGFNFVGQSEVIETEFIKKEVEKETNPILDYDRIRFMPTTVPINGIFVPINLIRYSLDLTGSTTYGAIGFTDDDIKFRKEAFNQTFLNLSFYDTDNPLTSSLVSNITIFSRLKEMDYNQIGSLDALGEIKPANEVPLNFDVENQILNPLGFSEGYYIYDYKFPKGAALNKELFMRASFKNAKTGISLNLTTKSQADTIDNVIHQVYVKYKLVRNNSGYYYSIDNTYSSNITYNNLDVIVKLYQILVL